MESTIKRGRGRPPGSKNKKTIAAQKPAAVTEGKTRGRPKNSKNKNTDVAIQHVYTSSKCACRIKSPIMFTEVLCGDHRNRLTIDGK